MVKSWDDSLNSWSRDTSLSKEMSEWAIECVSKNIKEIQSLQQARNKNAPSEESKKEREVLIKKLKKQIRQGITNKENALDDISLNTPNSYKLQLSVPSNLNYLMKSWAAAEGRDLSSIALQCLENGLRTMKSKGVIPDSAVRRYEIACEKRIALAEANKTWEKYEELIETGVI
tara:strand:- start:530 stop:1051 length:522 start_codon:yes stop_codon:yes gene_type:complete